MEKKNQDISWFLVYHFLIQRILNWNSFAKKDKQNTLWRKIPQQCIHKVSWRRMVADQKYVMKYVQSC